MRTKNKYQHGYRDFSDVLEKTFGHIYVFKLGPRTKRGMARVWCRDDRGFPDRLILVHHLRSGVNKGTSRPKGSWYPNQDGYLSTERAGKRILQHREVMEKYLGRKLVKSETVHHRGPKTDNRIEMLSLRNKAHGEGQSIHDQVVWLRSLGIPVGKVPAKIRKIWKD